MDTIRHARLFVNGSFQTGTVRFDEKIREVILENINAGFSGDRPDAGHGQNTRDGYTPEAEYYVIPGLIDIHTHGALGADASDADARELQTLGKWYARHGITSFCPTTMTLPEEILGKCMGVIKEYRRPEGGAKLAGVNLEGPFVSREKCGAQNPDYVQKPDIGMLERLQEESGGAVRLITVAPESEGAVEFIRKASKSGITVSVGHTACTYETAREAFEAGAGNLTHLYNAMPPLHHRKPGPIAAAADAGISAELICDGLHVHPAMVRMAFRMFGEKLVLISDSLRCAGMPDGDYMLGGQLVTLSAGVARLSGTDTIAGSSIHLMEAVRRAAGFGIPLEAAVYAATEAPAKVLHREGQIGRIAENYPADLAVLDRELNVKSVYIDGKQVSGISS